mmetsp:Transcript_24592/g.61707  ORF Transcript_24592/g.61707 Transcript_24592/m.61707 type:complete len:212 (-) Transcript_24592:91-726(-)
MLQHVPKSVQRVRLPLLRGPRVPRHSRRKARRPRRPRRALLQQPAEVRLCGGVARVGRKLQPVQGTRVIRPHPPSSHVEFAQPSLRLGVALLGGSCEPANSGCETVWDTPTGLVQSGQARLCPWVALLRRQGEPPCRLPEVARPLHALQVLHTQRKLRVPLAPEGGLPHGLQHICICVHWQVPHPGCSRRHRCAHDIFLFQKGCAPDPVCA